MENKLSLFSVCVRKNFENRNRHQGCLKSNFFSEYIFNDLLNTFICVFITLGLLFFKKWDKQTLYSFPLYYTFCPLLSRHYQILNSKMIFAFYF